MMVEPYWRLRYTCYFELLVGPMWSSIFPASSRSCDTIALHVTKLQCMVFGNLDAKDKARVTTEMNRYILIHLYHRRCQTSLSPNIRGNMLVSQTRRRERYTSRGMVHRIIRITPKAGLGYQAELLDKGSTGNGGQHMEDSH